MSFFCIIWFLVLLKFRFWKIIEIFSAVTFFAFLGGKICLLSFANVEDMFFFVLL